MQANQPTASQSSNTVLRVVIVLALLLFVLCIVIPVCVIAVLALMSPSIANVFSRVTSGMGGY